QVKLTRTAAKSCRRRWAGELLFDGELPSDGLSPAGALRVRRPGSTVMVITTPLIWKLVGGGTAHAAGGRSGTLGGTQRVDAGAGGIEAAPCRPSPQLGHLLGGGDGNGYDVFGCLLETQVQKRRQPAAGLDLCAGPVAVLGTIAGALAQAI